MKHKAMRRRVAVLLAVMLLGGCSSPTAVPPAPETAAPMASATPSAMAQTTPPPTPTPTPKPTAPPTATPAPAPTLSPDAAATPFAIDHYVLQPDQRARLTPDEQAQYRALVDGLIARAESAEMSGDAPSDERVLYALRQHPFYFLLDSIELSGGTAVLRYAYPAEEHTAIIDYLDSEYSAILTALIDDDMNELERVLAVYQYFGRRLRYDRLWVSNIDDPYQYPHIRVYEALTTNGGVCHSYAYAMYYALLLLGIDCFYQYGETVQGRDPHMWNIVAIDGSYFHIDATWDRAREGDYVGLSYFGRTDAERKKGLLYNFAATHDSDAYGMVTADDERLHTFADVLRFEFDSEPHRIVLYRRDGSRALFDTETWAVVE